MAGVGGTTPGRTGSDAHRVGVIGAGFIGEVHARALRRAGARLVGVAASSPETTAEAVTRLGAERGFGAEDLATSPDVDVVHICTPNHLHRPLAQAALEAGKHVVCEKPLATDPGEAAELSALADRSGGVATVPFVYRFYPMVREARARVANGPLAVRLVHGGYLQDWLSTDAGRQLARRRRAVRPLPGLRRHRLALVRPRRVRDGGPPRIGVLRAGDRGARACAHRCPRARVRHRGRRRTSAGGHHRGRGAGALPHLRRGQRLGGRQPDLRRPQEPAPARDRDRRPHPGLRPGAPGHALARAARTLGGARARPEPARPRRGAGTPPSRPATRRATRTASTPSSPTPCAPSTPAAAGASTGCPTFADGERAVQITDAVVRSSRVGGWVDVSAGAPVDRQEVAP